MPKQNIRTNNANGEVIVLLHGLLASSAYWKRVSRQLTKRGYRVITLDLLGFGKAANQAARSYTYVEHVAHIHRYLETLDLPKPFIVAGHSMGAVLAARYSLQYPKEVKQLFLLNPPLYTSRDQAHSTLRGTNWLYRFLLDSRLRNAGWMLMKKIPTRLIGNHSTAARELSLLNIIESAEFIGDLEKLHTDAVLVVGKNDRPIYRENLAAMQLPKNVRVVIENVPHHSPIVRPELVARTISRKN